MPRLQLSLKLSFTLLATLFLTLGHSAHALQPGSCLTTDQPQVILENELASLDWQADGNLALKLQASHGGDILWQPPAYNGGKSLCLLDEGNLIIAAEKINFAKSVPIDLKPGQCLTAGKTIASNEIVSLIWQDDGNLVLYQLPTGKAKKKRAVWATNTWANGEEGKLRDLCFDLDGVLRVYNDKKLPIWSSKTDDRGSSLELGPNCNLRILDSSDRPIWKSILRPSFNSKKICNLEKRNLWQAFEHHKAMSNEGMLIPHSYSGLSLSECQLYLGNENGIAWESSTEYCIPISKKAYSKNNMSFNIDRFYEHPKLRSKFIGAETSGVGSIKNSNNHLKPYIKIFDGRQFSFDYIQLVNRSNSHLAIDEKTSFTPSSIEYRGVWKLCTDPDFKGKCIEIKSKNVARISDVAKELGDNWNDAISSAKLLGYIDTESDYLIRARFADTRKICANVPEKSNTSYTFQLTDLDNQLLTNSGGRKSECKLSFTDSETKKCCDTGYDGTDSPVYLSWQKQQSLSTNKNPVLSLHITSDEKLQHGKVAEAALQEVEITEEESVSDQVKLCINGQSRHCERSTTASEE